MMDWLARLRPWLNALLILLLMLPLARLAWRAFVPAEAPLPPAAASGRVGAVARPAQPIDVAQLRRSMLFGQTASVGPNGELPDSTLPLKLQGVIAAGESPDAVAIFDGGDAKLRAVRVGMAVQPNVVIKAVYKDNVVVNNNGRDERIKLQLPPPLSLNSPPPPSSVYPPGIDPAGGSAQSYISQSVPGAYNPAMPQQQMQQQPSYPGYNGPPPSVSSGAMGMPPGPPSWQTQ